MLWKARCYKRLFNGVQSQDQPCPTNSWVLLSWGFQRLLPGAAPALGLMEGKFPRQLKELLIFPWHCPRAAGLSPAQPSPGSAQSQSNPSPIPSPSPVQSNPSSVPGPAESQSSPSPSPIPVPSQPSCSTSRACLSQPSALSRTHRDIHSSGTSPGLPGHFGCFLHRIKELPGLSVNILWRNNIKRDI